MRRIETVRPPRLATLEDVVRFVQRKWLHSLLLVAGFRFDVERKP